MKTRHIAILLVALGLLLLSSCSAGNDTSTTKWLNKTLWETNVTSPDITGPVNLKIAFEDNEYRFQMESSKSMGSARSVIASYDFPRISLTCPPGQGKPESTLWSGTFSSDGKTLTFPDFDLTIYEMGLLKNVVFNRQ